MWIVRGQREGIQMRGTTCKNDRSETSPSVTKSKLILLATWQDNKLTDKLLGQRIAALFGKPEDLDDGGPIS